MLKKNKKINTSQEFLGYFLITCGILQLVMWCINLYQVIDVFSRSGSTTITESGVETIGNVSLMNSNFILIFAVLFLLSMLFIGIGVWIIKKRNKIAF